MTNPELRPAQAPTDPEYPYLHNKIPVVNGLAGFRSFEQQYPNFAFCPYLADKDAEGWARSTSRIFMNQVLPNFAYVPVQIRKGDLAGLRAFFEYVSHRADVPAVNITQPHKSNPVLRELYLGDAGSDGHIDTLIRNDRGELEPYDLNSAAFIEWYKDEVGEFEGKPVVLVGVGGVGEPIAKKVAAEHPASLSLIDVADKSTLARRLSRSVSEVSYASSLRGQLADGLPAGVVVINAAGKEGATNESQLWQLISKGANKGVFVDIRPHIKIDIVDEAKLRGWQVFTGHGMNARNDYVLMQANAARIPGATAPSFGEFKQLVARAS